MVRPRKNPAEEVKRGGPRKSDATNQFMIRLNDEDYEALRAHAKEADLSMAQVVRRAIREYLSS